MMNKLFLRRALYFLSLLAVGFPIWVWYDNAYLVWGKVALFEVFRVFGLVAFSVMWLHIVGGAYKKKLSRLINWQRFVNVSSMIVLISLILHPGLMLVALISSGEGSPFDYVGSGSTFLIWSAIIAWIVFVAYDWLKDKKGNDLILRNWNRVKLISTLGFFLVLYHSLGVGSDLQAGALQKLWWFYGISAAVAMIYNYVYLPSRQNIDA